MNKDELHISYINLLNEIEIENLRAIRIGDLMYSEIWYLLNKSQAQIEKETCFLLTKNCISAEYHEGKNGQFLLLSYYRGRSERDNYWKRVVSFFPDACEVIAHDLRTTEGHCDSFSLFEQKENTTLFEHYCIELNSIESEIHKKYLAAFLLVQTKWLTFIEKRLVDKKLLICYFDGGFFENIAVQIAKRKQIVTISCQHGQPIFQSKKFDLINQAQILNFKSDYFIATNLHTVDQFEKAGVDKNKIIEIGCFKDVRDLSEDRNVEKNTLCLFLDSPSLPFSNDTNREMINFVQEFASRANCRIFVKPHPLDQLTNQNSPFVNENITVLNPRESLDACLSATEFAICHASSVYLDLCERGIKSFVWASDQHYYPITDLSEDFVFSVDELVHKIKEWRKTGKEEQLLMKNRTRDHVLNVTGAKEKFVAFIQGILETHIAYTTDSNDVGL